MTPTFIGLIQIVIGAVLLFRRSLLGMFAFVLMSGMMGGSAALLLGGSSVPPIDLAAGFLMLRLMPRVRVDAKLFRRAARSLAPFIVFIGYAVLMAYIGPRLFAHAMYVTPLRPDFDSLHTGRLLYIIYYAVPLVPTFQNVTTSGYMIGALLLAVASYVIMTYPGGRDTLVRCAVAIGLLHSFFGVFDLAVRGTPLQLVIDIIRNGNYSQLDQQFAGFYRINGILPEPSSYAGYGLIWFVFLAECALRGVKPRGTVPAALILLFMLTIATSTTAYIGLAIYMIFLLLRLLLLPGGLRPLTLLALVGLALTGFLVVTGLVLFDPRLATTLGDLLHTLTVGKTSSISAIQRGFWARQGLEAFVVSDGLGIGAGSFRSSSFVTAVLGSTGIVGTAAFGVFLLSVWKPLRPSTYRSRAPDPRAIGAAAAWAAVVLVLTASFAAPSPDPGPDFSILAGAALGLRRRPGAARSRLPPAASIGSPDEARLDSLRLEHGPPR